jgi:hypothetical protein
MNFAKIVNGYEYKNSLFSSLNKNCGLTHIQYYSPYFRHLVSETNSLTEDSILLTPSNISNVVNKVKFFNAETDIKKVVNRLYNIKEFEDINNIYELCINVNSNNDIEHDIICKVSPIINPVFLFDNDVDIDELNINNIYESNNVPEVIKEEIEADNNFAYVESFILYNLNNLTNNNLTPLFPTYYGSVNGIAKHYYFNITEYLDDIYGSKRFDKIKKLYKILYYDNDCLSVSALSNSSSSSDTTECDSIDFDINSEIETNDDARNDDVARNDNDDNSKDFFSMIEEKLEGNTSKSTDNNKNSISNAIPIDNLFDDLTFTNVLNTNDADTNALNADTNALNTNTTNINTEKQLLFPELDFDNIPEEDMFKPDNKFMHVCLENYPVSYCFMEKLDYTLEDYLEQEMCYLRNEEWYAIFFQLAYGLAVANKLFNFVHNDLHECNVMFKETDEEFIYYTINGITYQVPTYGKIVKIIDFARSTIKFADKWIISNHYNEDKEAYGIYDIPDKNGHYPADDTNVIKPNTSFDLIRFFTTISKYVEENNEEVYDFIYKWCYDNDKDCNMIDEENEFELYINIAHNCHNCEPEEFLKDPVFNMFINNSSDTLPENALKYNFTECDI